MFSCIQGGMAFRTAFGVDGLGRGWEFGLGMALCVDVFRARDA